MSILYGGAGGSLPGQDKDEIFIAESLRAV
jgi:hypothetical protein